MNLSQQSSHTPPLVSVYCMAYNQEKTVAQTIESILSQETDFPFELIVHDDASTDSTADIIRDYAARYPGVVRPVMQAENKYRDHNLIQEYIHPLGRGQLIALCEGDDYWCDPHKLQLQADILRRDPAYTLCFHAVNRLTPDGALSPFRPLKKSGAVAPGLVVKRGGMFCPTVSLMFRREIFDSWPAFRAAADVYDYPLQVLAAARGKIYYCDRIMAVYRYAFAGSWTSDHLSQVDHRHIENETRWLALFDDETEGRFRREIDFHMTHVWFTEYRKTLDPKLRARAKPYIRRLPLRERLLFTGLFSFFALCGKPANKLFEALKKRLLK